MQLPGLVPVLGHSPAQVSPCTSCLPGAMSQGGDHAKLPASGVVPAKNRIMLRIYREGQSPGLTSFHHSFCPPWQLCCLHRASSRNSECCPGFVPALSSPPCLCCLWSSFQYQGTIVCCQCLLVCWEEPPQLSKQSPSSFLEGLPIGSLTHSLSFIEKQLRNIDSVTGIAQTLQVHW